MAGESMVDEAYYVAKIMFNNGSLTDNKMNKHGEKTGFRFNLKSCLRSGATGKFIHLNSSMSNNHLFMLQLHNIASCTDARHNICWACFKLMFSEL